MKMHKTPMPSYWASYLINGDDSGLEDGEKQRIDAYLCQEGIDDVMLDDDEESYFSWSCDLYGSEYPGGDLIEYSVTYVTEIPIDLEDAK